MGLHDPMTWIVHSGEAVHAPNNGPVWQCVALTCFSADAQTERRRGLWDRHAKCNVYGIARKLCGSDMHSAVSGQDLAREEPRKSRLQERDGDHLDMLGRFTSTHSKYLSTLPMMSFGLTSVMAMKSLHSRSVNSVQNFGDIEPCLVLDILGRGIIMVVPSFAVIREAMCVFDS